MLEEILKGNALAGEELESLVSPVEPEAGIDDQSAEILAELAADPEITDEELEMLEMAAEQLGPEFPEYAMEYLADKESEYDGEEVLPEELDAEYGGGYGETGTEY
jgi:hypothetical protein